MILRLATCGTVVLAAALSFMACGSSSSSGGSTNTNKNPVTMSPASGSTLPDATVGSAYNQTFTVTSGGVSPYNIQAAGVPSGLTFASTSPSATLSGNPTQAGSAVFQLMVTDAASQVTTVNYQLTIAPVGGLLTLAPTSIPSPVRNVAYSQAITAVGGTGPFTWALSGTLPPGITLGTSTGGTNTISGTTNQSGTTTFTITASDSSSPSKPGSVTYTTTVQ